VRLHKFQDNEEYLARQRAGTKNRARHGWTTDATDAELELVSHWIHEHIPGAVAGLCHGAASGHEVDLLQEALPRCKVWGTDLSPLREDIIEHDFHARVRKWLSRFDFVYSNSIDHSNNPQLAIRRWLEQVNQNGVLFLTWTYRHVWGETRPAFPLPGGDCFAASLHEYLWFCEAAGSVRDLLYVKPGKFSYVVIVTGKR
jgi:hypothetical protein